jgi:6-phosphogluconate dehydrogenase
VKPIFQSIAARAETGEICCEWIGSGGAGHFVKMVHNGIEYGDMELIAETYDIARRGMGKTVPEIASYFDQWNKGLLKSFLIEITATILKKKDTDGAPLIDAILDVAGQKGTGKWTALCALDLALPITLITESVFQRFLSSLLEMRQEASLLFKEESLKVSVTPQDLEGALYAAKIMSYVQGFLLLKEASHAWKWDLDLGACALMWRGGCIIRSVFLGKIKDAYDRNKDLSLLAFDPYFQKELIQHLPSLRRIVSFGALAGVPLPCFSSALSFFDSIRSATLPTTLIQAQRDLFGAHTFERKDSPRGIFFHADWNM